MAPAAIATEWKDKGEAAAGVGGWASVTHIFLSALPLLSSQHQKQPGCGPV